MYKRIFATFCALSAFLFTAASENRFFSNIGIENGLSNSAVMSICQDRNGYLWIATMNGLNRYDGFTVKNFFSENISGLPSNYIKSLCPYGDDMLAGTDNGLCVYDSSIDKFRNVICEKGGMPDIRDMDTGFDGVIYIAASEGLWSYDGGEYARKICDEPDLVKISMDRNGGIWLVSENKMVFLSERGDIIDTYGPEDFPEALDGESKFSEIYVDANGKIWIGTVDDGLFWFEEKEKKLYRFTPDESVEETVRYVRCINYSRNGILWVGAENGMFAFDLISQTCVHYSKNYDYPNQGISSNATYCIYKSNEEIIWVGTYFGGVDYTDIDIDRMSFLTADGGNSQLGGHAISTITEDRSGRMWYGSEDNGITVTTSRMENCYLNTQTSPSLAGNNVHSIVEDSDGNMWAGCYLDGIIRISSDLKYTEKVCDLKTDINELMFSGEDELLISTVLGLFKYDRKDGRLEEFHKEYFGGKDITMFKDKKNRIWICTDDGWVFKYQPGQNNTLSRTDIQETVKAGVCSSDGSMWLCTGKGELIRLDTEKDKVTERHTLKEIETNLFISSIKEDTYGRVWISTHNGILLFNPVNQQTNKYRICHDIISNQFNGNASYSSRNGKIYFGSINGVCIISPNTISNEKVMNNLPTVHISGLRISDKYIRPGDGTGILQKGIDGMDRLELRHSIPSISLDISPLYYSDDFQEQYRIRYRLSGTEQNYSETAAGPFTATYRNVVPGKYRFELSLVNSNGKVLDSRTIDLIITSGFLSSAGMKIVYILLILSAAAFTSVYIRRRVKEYRVLVSDSRKADALSHLASEMEGPLSILTAALPPTDSTYEEKEEKTGIQDSDTINRNITKIKSLYSDMIHYRVNEYSGESADNRMTYTEQTEEKQAIDTAAGNKGTEDIPAAHRKIDIQKYTVLLAGKDGEFCRILVKRMKKEYNVRYAGDSGSLMKTLTPDIDIAIIESGMASPDVYSMCDRIKKSDRLKHIPLIIIGSGNDRQARMKGLEHGAYAYLDKPFEYHELHVVMSNIIQDQNNIRRYYQDKVNTVDVEMVSNKEIGFIDDLTRYVRANIQNENLNVSLLAGYMHISKSLLYSRIKKAIDMGASDFITKIRMEMASEKLLTTDKSISEISWEVGFSSPGYFIKSFRKHFGKTPKEYRTESTEAETES